MKTNLKAEFKVFNTNGKGETSIGLVLKGELSDAQILALHRLKAVGTVFVDIFDGQASIEDYGDEEPRQRRGIAYSVNGGSVEVQDKQLTIDEVEYVPNTPEQGYKMYLEACAELEEEPVEFDVWVNRVRPFEIDENADIINDEHYQTKILDYDHYAADNGEPSEDEREIESMRSEAEEEPKARAPRVTKKEKEAKEAAEKLIKSGRSSS